MIVCYSKDKIMSKIVVLNTKTMNYDEVTGISADVGFSIQTDFTTFHINIVDDTTLEVMTISNRGIGAMSVEPKSSNVLHIKTIN